MDKFYDVFGGESFYEPTVSLFNDLPYESKDPMLVDGMESLIPNFNYNRDNAILDVCEQFGRDLVIDTKWATTLKRYMFNFTTRKVGITDYGEFFGSPYLGLQKITFTTADRNEWFTDIWDVDEEELKESLHECKWVNKDWAVTGDVFNLTIPYLLWKIQQSKQLPSGMKREAQIIVLFMYHCKCITSMIHNDYPYLAKPEIVYETYNRLSLKYDIKKYESWRALFLARAEYILSPTTGIHYKTFMTMNDDKKIIYMVGDIQDRLRGLVNDINKVFHDVKNRTNIMQLDKAHVNMEEGMTVKEIAKQVNVYKNYAKQILSAPTGFYRDEYADIIVKKIDNAPKDKLERILKEFPGNYQAKNKRGQYYQEFVDEVLTHLFEYLTNNRIKQTNLREVINRMAGTYASPRNQNESVLKMRAMGDDIVQDLTGIRTRVTYSSLRTALMLYIVLRVLTKDRN
ncbi:phage protein [Vibrio phage pTD1]|uniref:Phage protein n=1 Tax=Vibrio phage pTD1 TaxID=1938577 RepID=A0A1Q2U331_9CAUD|nr:phage protein [Vibrio phage pTD1]BAW98363.1 phage protein [Vibrio phage pTD1]